MRKNGFTLVEVMASFVILAVAMVGILQMASLDAYLGGYEEESASAVSLMRRKVEELRLKDFTTDVSDAVGSTYTGFDQYVFTVGQDVNWSGNPYLKRVTATETWNDQHGQARHETVNFLVADY
jgi:prepilin-type N-terminal cleavage/methylation domain-containing protein